MTTGWEKFEELMKAEMMKVYSETMVEHAMDPKNVGSMEDADSFARVTGPCGDTMEIWLKVRNRMIANATFMTDGCGTTIAAGSMVTQLAKGKNIIQAQNIGQSNVLEALGGLSEESQHCALLAANTLKEAVKDYLATEKEPWKRAYHKH